MVRCNNIHNYLCKTFLIIVILIFLQNSSLSQHQQELKKIEREIQKNQRLIKKAQKKEKIALKDIENIEQNLMISRKKIDQLIKDKNYTTLKIKRLKTTLNDLQNNFLYIKNNIKTVLQNWYIFNIIYSYNILSNGDFKENSIRYEILKKLNKKNNEYINRVINKKKSYAEKIKEYQREYNKLKKMQAILELNLKSIQTERELKRIYLKKLKKEKKNYKNYLLSLERKKKNIQKAIKNILYAAKRKNKKANQGKGILSHYKNLIEKPVKGTIISHFGKKWNNEYEIYINNDGVEFKTINNEIYSPCRGTVLFADWIKGKGNVVIINYDSHLSLIFGNLDEIFVKKDQIVEKKQIIGKINNLDNNNVLYFGTWFDGKPINPEYIIK